MELVRVLHRERIGVLRIEGGHIGGVEQFAFRVPHNRDGNALPLLRNQRQHRIGEIVEKIRIKKYKKRASDEDAPSPYSLLSQSSISIRAMESFSGISGRLSFLNHAPADSSECCKRISP